MSRELTARATKYCLMFGCGIAGRTVDTRLKDCGFMPVLNFVGIFQTKLSIIGNFFEKILIKKFQQN